MRAFLEVVWWPFQWAAEWVLDVVWRLVGLRRGHLIIGVWTAALLAASRFHFSDPEGSVWLLAMQVVQAAIIAALALLRSMSPVVASGVEAGLGLFYALVRALIGGFVVVAFLVFVSSVVTDGAVLLVLSSLLFKVAEVFLWMEEEGPRRGEPVLSRLVGWLVGCGVLGGTL